MTVAISDTVNQIFRIHASYSTSETFLETYQKYGTPVVITRLLNGELDWNLEYLYKAIGFKQMGLISSHELFYSRENVRLLILDCSNVVGACLAGSETSANGQPLIAM